MKLGEWIHALLYSRAISNFDENGVPERAFIEDIESLPEEAKHFFVPYWWASHQILNKSVLDTGCGMGSATYYFSKFTARITGIDVSKISIEFASMRYHSGNLNFRAMDVLHLDYPDSSFDVVTSFELIEHLNAENQIRYLLEVRRVLKEGGVLLFSTPNKNLTPGNNSYHLHEVDYEELNGLLSGIFSGVAILGVNKKSEILEDVTDCPILIGRAMKGDPCKYPESMGNYSHDTRSLSTPDALTKEELGFLISEIGKCSCINCLRIVKKLRQQQEQQEQPE